MHISKQDLIQNPRLLKLISHADQLALGLILPPPLPTLALNPPLTNSRPSTKSTSTASKPELQSHAEFLHWIKKLNRSLPTNKPLLAIHANPTKPSGILPGWPDFSLFYLSRFNPLFIEFKHPKTSKTSPAQTLVQSYLKNLGHHIHTVTSSQQAINLTIAHFNL